MEAQKDLNNFPTLVTAIEGLHVQLQNQAKQSVNQLLTIRNYLIGYYIVEFEQGGEDRAVYGQNLIPELAAKLSIKGLTQSELFRCKQFYICYPQILGTLSQLLGERLPKQILGTLSQKSHTPSQSSSMNGMEPLQLLSKLAYSHFVEFIKINDPLKRVFYELESIKGTWSVRELKRQINSQLFERSALSKKPEVMNASLPQSLSLPKDILKDVYVFEFLELGQLEKVHETDLETALLDHLQAFILELGHGFCFEARQKKLLIGDTYFFVDLLFYHRILKCHVLIELKVGEFDHGQAGQLNTYLNYFKKEIQQSDDQAPIGILLVTHKNEALVEYATAGMDEQLFVKEYLMQLPSTEQLKMYIENELKKWNQ